MFLIAGLPSALPGVVPFFYLDDKPKDAKWLTPEEKDIVISSLTVHDTPLGLAEENTLGQAFRDPKIYLLAFVYFSLLCGGYVVSFWLPTIIKGFGVTDILQIGLYSIIPYGITGLLMVYWGRHSDLKLERRWHYMILWVIRAIALVVSTMISDAFWVSMALITVATVGSVAPLPIFWATPTSFLSAFAAAAGIAIITSLGNMAGFLSPYILGLIKSSTGSLTIGICLTAAIVILGALSVLAAIPGSGCRGTSGTAASRLKPAK